MLTSKILRVLLLFVLLNSFVLNSCISETYSTPIPSDGIERDMYDLALSNITLLPSLLDTSNPLLQYYLANMDDFNRNLLFDTNYSTPDKILVMLPSSNQDSIIQQHLSLETDYIIPNYAGLALNCTYQANYLFSGNTLHAECYEQLSCYNTAEISGFTGIGYVVFVYDTNSPQVVTAFYSNNNGQVIVKSTITYTPGMSVIIDSSLDYFEYGGFPYAACTLFGDDSFSTHEYSIN